MNKQLATLKQVAPSTSTVLILGESGVGKEIAARAVHQWSTRNQEHFIAVNCTALSPQLLESEFFGHEKGAFTGAIKRKKGRFEMAHKGTLFLDEIGDLSLDLQAKLLRVLQDKEFQRVGGMESIYSDFRLIAATNRNLKERIQQGLFRQDLYYRLNVISLSLPPLRERKEDIPSLAQFFIQNVATSLNVSPPQLSTPFLQALSLYNWPGNIRELANVIERAVVLCRHHILNPDLLPIEIQKKSPLFESSDFGLSDFEASTSNSLTLKEQIDLFKKRRIEQTLKANRYHQEKTAQQLGIKPSNLSRLMKDLDLR
jgi:transcriptional regulator with PAS, ATPase and Fis domain